MRFKMLLWILGLRLGFLSKNNDAFQKQLGDKEAIFQCQTRDASVARYFVVAEGDVTSYSGMHPSPDMVLSFQDAVYAYEVISQSAKNSKIFMAGVQEQKITATGDLSLLMWVIGLAKYLPPKKEVKNG